MFLPFQAMLLPCIAAVLVTGCEQKPPSPILAERVFSAEDRRVARLLSLGSSSAIPEEEGSSPIERAVLCRYLVEGLRSRIQLAGGLRGDVGKGFEIVRDLYDQRIRAAAGRGQVPSGEDLAKGIDEAERGQRAIACIERLQRSG